MSLYLWIGLGVAAFCLLTGLAVMVHTAWLSRGRSRDGVTRE